MKKDKIFIEISNSDVYNKLLDLEKSINAFHQNNYEQHNMIIKRQDYTNGKVKKSVWVASTALTVTLILMGFLFQHLSG